MKSFWISNLLAEISRQERTHPAHVDRLRASRDLDEWAEKLGMDGKIACDEDASRASWYAVLAKCAGAVFRSRSRGDLGERLIRLAAVALRFAEQVDEADEGDLDLDRAESEPPGISFFGDERTEPNIGAWRFVALDCERGGCAEAEGAFLPARLGFRANLAIGPRTAKSLSVDQFVFGARVAMDHGRKVRIIASGEEVGFEFISIKLRSKVEGTAFGVVELAENESIEAPRRAFLRSHYDEECYNQLIRRIHRLQTKGKIDEH